MGEMRQYRAGERTFQLAAGFLRVMQGDNPLDASAVHPEAYPVVERSVERAGGSFVPNSIELAAPVALITGPNSGGKSTVLQSILLAVQAAQAQTPGDVFPLNGLLAQLGEFKDAHSAFAREYKACVFLNPLT